MKTAIALNQEKDNRVNLNDLLKRKKHQDHLKKILNIKIFTAALIFGAIILVFIDL